MKKKLLSVLLVLLLALLCGCAKENTAPSAVETQEPPQSTAEIQVFRVDTVDPDGEEEEPEALPEEEAGDEEEEGESESAPEPTPVPQALPMDENTAVRDLELVRVLSYIPDLQVDLKYATEDNYTGKVVYTFDEPYLRYGTVKKLAQAQSRLKEQGYELVLWDAFRPTEAQFVLFDAFPNGNFVANPYGGGHSSHTSGGTVDVALMKDGALVALPSGFDEFSALGDRNYNDVSAEAAANAKTLETVMTACGFTGYFGEWWHYTDNTGYNYDDVEFAKLPEQASGGCESVCNEYINIRRMPNVSSEAIGRVPNGEQMTVLGYYSYFTHIQYGDVVGYVNSDYTKPAN